MDKENKLITLALILMVLVMTFNYVSPTLKRTGPTFYNVVGADTVAHMGAIRSIRAGNPPWIDQYYNNGIPRAYSWLWHLVMAGIPLSVNFLLLWSPLISWILCLLAVFYAGKLMFGRRYGLYFAMFYFFMMDNSIINPNPKNWLMGLFFLSAAFINESFTDEKLLKSWFAGLIIGISFMTYSMMIGLFAVPVILFFFHLDNWKRNLLKVSLMTVAGLVVSAIYWVPIVVNVDSTIQTQNIASSAVQYAGESFFTRIWDITGNYFSVYWYFIPLFMIGLYAMYQLRKNELKLFFAMYIAFFAGSMHDYITRPLLNWAGVQPFYFPEYAYWTFSIVIVFGLIACIDYVVNALRKAHTELIIGSILLALVLISGGMRVSEYLTVGPDSWKGFIQQSYKPMDPMISKPAAWIDQNVKNDEVIAAHPMYSYMIFGLTGKHIYASMYGHMLSLSDDDWRRVDIREVYETSDVNRALELLNKGSADYLIIDPFVLQSEWYQDNYYDIFEGVPPKPVVNNLDKFLNNEHFEQVYTYGYVKIFKIKY